MPKTEDGEYELVLGNRQLLSIFFIVVVLLGIGFTLGYILGRNSSGSEVALKTSEKTSDASTPVDLPPPPTEAKTAAAVEPTPEPPAETPKPAPSRKTPAEPVTPPTSSKPFRTGAPPAGSVFIQIAAVAKADAEMEASTIAKKGYPTWVAPNPSNPELFSVLVGPYADKGDLAKAKAALEQLGFRKAFRKEIK